MFITKRPATTGDTEFARLIHHRAYREVVILQYGLWEEASQDKFFVAAWSVATHEIILCDDVPCGYLCVEQRKDSIFLREIVIAPEFQGKGIGTSLLEEVIDQAKMRRLKVRLQTHQMNRAAELYLRLGFRESGRTSTHILMEWTGVE